MPKKKAAKKVPKKTSPTVSRHKDSIYTQEGKTYSHRTKKAKPTKESPEHIYAANERVMLDGDEWEVAHNTITQQLQLRHPKKGNLTVTAEQVMLVPSSRKP